MHSHDGTDEDRYKKVETREGVGTVACAGETYANVRYGIARFQGMTRAGLPVPGVHRLDGHLEFENTEALQALVGSEVSLHLDDGSVMKLELLDSEGRVVAHGHGPGRCLCC